MYNKISKDAFHVTITNMFLLCNTHHGLRNNSYGGGINGNNLIARLA